jgi:sulfur carrier protein
MNIIVNGQKEDLPQGTSLEDIIKAKAKDPALVIAELNGTVIERSRWNTAPLKNNDVLELVAFVGGG